MANGDLLTNINATKKGWGLGLTALMQTFSVFFVSLALPVTLRAAGVPESFDPGNLIDAQTYIATSSMTVDEIQSFLTSQGGSLSSYSENGKSAAQIIWGAAHGEGDASGNCSGSTTCSGITIDSSTGTVNPKVILVTLQKEQSLITATNPSQGTLDIAMGYGCPDSGGCNASYKGFTKQVQNAAWQLRYNYGRATSDSFSDYKVGQTMTFSNTISPYNPPATQAVTLSNAATASLYRYTPHVYNGNYNFWKTYKSWFGRWQAAMVSQTSNKTISQGESAMFSVAIKNTGEETWAGDVVRLGTARSNDRVSNLVREDRTGGNASGWISANRVSLVESSVAPGGTGTFRFYYTAPTDLAPGAYLEYFNLVADGVTWFDDLGITWTITTTTVRDGFRASVVSKPASSTLAPGTSQQFEVKLKNTGYFTWKQGTINLATDLPRDRIPPFIREDRASGNPSGWVSANRVGLVEASVAPGETGTYRFWYTVPTDAKASVSHEVFRPVYDGFDWLADSSFDLAWDVTVASREQLLTTKWVSQNSYPTLHPGESYQFVLQVKNTGPVTWTQGQVNLGTDKNRDRIPPFIREDRVSGNPSGWVSANRVGLVEASVAPGQTGTYQFWYTVPTDAPAGTYRESFRQVHDAVDWMDDWGIYWNVTVVR